MTTEEAMADQTALTLHDDTLDVLFEYVKGQTAGQVGWAEQLDAKGVQLFTGASVVVGLAGLGTVATNGGADSAAGALVAAVVFYLAAAFTAFFLLRVRPWRISGHADTLWREHWADPPSDIKHAIVEDAAESVAYNRQVLHDKARWLTAMQIVLTCEVVSVGVAIILARLA